MKTLVIGGTGLVGSRCADVFEKYGLVTRASRHGKVPVDITEEHKIVHLVETVNPDVVILAAAFTNVDACEDNNDLAWKMNVDGMRKVITASRGRRIVYFSTDYVFDGVSGPYDESATPNPINWYGRTKLQAENLLLERAPDSLVIRTTNVYDLPDEKNFLSRCITCFSRGESVQCPRDQYASPTWARMLSAVTGELVNRGASGIYNVVGDDYMSRYDFGVMIARTFGYPESLVVSKSTADLDQTAERPLRGGLKTEKVKSFLGDEVVRDMYTWVSTQPALERIKKDVALDERFKDWENLVE